MVSYLSKYFQLPNQTILFSDITFDFSAEAYDCQVLPPDAVVKPTEDPPTDSATTTASNSEPQFCTFQEDFCHWNIDSGLNDTEAFVFKRTKGELQDGTHGPDADHDTSKTNYFIWADAALGNPDTQTAISSPQFSTTKPFCFSFWFALTVRTPTAFKYKTNYSDFSSLVMEFVRSKLRSRAGLTCQPPSGSCKASLTFGNMVK